MTDDPRAVIPLEGLNDYLFKPGRRERMAPRREVRPVLDAQGQPTGQMEEGKELPVEEQFLFGQVLVNLLMTTKQPDSMGKVRALGRVVDRLEEAMQAGEPYQAGEIALGLMREAIRTNGMGYRPYILAQLLDQIGTGEENSEEG
jgi:hypothetical protein